MKKLIFAGDWTLEQKVGVQRYAYQILKQIDNMLLIGELKYDVVLLVPVNYDDILHFKKITIVKKGKVLGKIQKHYWQQMIFPMYVRKHHGIGIDLTAALPVWGCDICAIHDCIQEAYPENFSDHKLFLELLKFKRKMITNSKKCHIITLTEDSRNELLKYYPKSKGKVSIVTCGWEHMQDTDTDNSILSKLNLFEGTEFFFSLGSKYRHKNFKWILDTARFNQKYLFVITGTNVFSNNEDELKIKVPKNVIFTGYISNEQIKTLMQNCKALIQPSYYEGFGLPPLEALSVGTSIIVSNRSSLPEIYGDSAYYIDPDIVCCNLDELMSKSISKATNILEDYTWTKAAKQLLSVIDMVKR